MILGESLEKVGLRWKVLRLLVGYCEESLD